MSNEENYLKKRIREFNRLYELAKKIPNVSSEILKTFYNNGMEDLQQGEIDAKDSKKIIIITEKRIKENILSIHESNLFKDLNEDCNKVLDYYRNEMLLNKRKTCFFQENIVQEVLRVNNLFLERISTFSQTILKEFYNDSYASLILLRSNIENLILYFYYVKELEKLFHKEKWLEIARLNARILYTKKKETETRFESFQEMDYLDVVNALVTMHGAKEKPLHISDALKSFFESMEKDEQFKLDETFKTPILNGYAKKKPNIILMSKINYSKISYDQLCEVVHPVAIYRKKYPFDNEDPNVKIKFALSFGVLPYVINLYFYGINIYEKIRALEFKKINTIEKELENSIQIIMDKKQLEFAKQYKNEDSLPNETKKFLEQAYKKILNKIDN